MRIHTKIMRINAKTMRILAKTLSIHEIHGQTMRIHANNSSAAGN